MRYWFVIVGSGAVLLACGGSYAGGPLASGVIAVPPQRAMLAALDKNEQASERSSSPEDRLSRNKVEAEATVGDSDFRAEQQKALAGDGESAMRVAQMYRRGSNGVSRDERKMVQWLLHGSALNNGAASYQLYLHYLELKLDRDAVYFENRALEQGYKPPPRLDPRRG